MSSIEELIAELCPLGVEFKPLGDCISRNMGGGTPSRSNSSYWNGDIPWASVGELSVAGNVIQSTRSSITREGLKESSSNVVKRGDVIVAVKISPGKMKIAGRDIAINQDLRGLTLREFIDSKFLTYYFQTVSVVGDGTIVKGITNSTLERIRVPVPPLKIQHEIVKVLDSFTQLAVELETELGLRQRQYAHYRDLLMNGQSAEADWATIGDIGPVRMCKRVFKEETSPVGEIPFYKIGTFGGVPDAFISRSLYEDYRRRYSFPKVGDILLSAAGTIGRAIPYDGKVAYFQDSNIVWVDNPETRVLNAFLYYLYQEIKWSTDGGTIRRLYNDNILKTRIPIPPMNEQRRIVGILDEFSLLLNDPSVGLPAEITARRSQYVHYRDRLLTFEEAAA